MKKIHRPCPRHHNQLSSESARERLKPRGYAAAYAVLGAVAAVVALAGLHGGRATAVTGAPVPVSVTNTATSPVEGHDINNMGHDPFGARWLPTLNTPSQFTVPAGKKLVINQMSAYSTSSTRLDYYISGTTNSNNCSVVVPVTASNATYRYAIQQVNFIADAGSIVYFGFRDSNSGDTSGAYFDVHGYFIDAP